MNGADCYYTGLSERNHPETTLLGEKPPCLRYRFVRGGLGGFFCGVISLLGVVWVVSFVDGLPC